jgi:hypothetical protein
MTRAVPMHVLAAVVGVVFIPLDALCIGGFVAFPDRWVACFGALSLSALLQVIAGIAAVAAYVSHRRREGRGPLAPLVMGWLAAVSAPVIWLGALVFLLGTNELF